MGLRRGCAELSGVALRVPLLRVPLVEVGLHQAPRATPAVERPGARSSGAVLPRPRNPGLVGSVVVEFPVRVGAHGEEDECAPGAARDRLHAMVRVPDVDDSATSDVRVARGYYYVFVRIRRPWSVVRMARVQEIRADPWVGVGNRYGEREVAVIIGIVIIILIVLTVAIMIALKIIINIING